KISNRPGKSARSLSEVIWRDCNVFSKTCGRTNGSGSFKSYSEFVSCTIKFPKRRKNVDPILCGIQN
ncbi:MAG TPA: hypothetical protein PKN56_26155, partial [Leptospiraceae bacterium]|nr:hypothetical protein [Leptospiraceae bacterium]